ncbi:spore germination protein GerPE [Oceanobacillus jordanicus]|uniref:Spore germination protein GerPE n=1 Tax=Oceanobacillus jordanicus TaxID=2867266 RepID=A0AAW5B3A0_9BACI|nr:spore germination protein GerPE [Oceanobacillus jordanicus]MCG3418438.1 spore germination protein GerPE [Oceanobacillus jordanicus]
MNRRIASVNQIQVNTVNFSGILSIGDTENSKQISRGIALQKEGSYFTKKDELFFEDFPLFKMEPKIVSNNNNVQMRTYQHDENIHVQRVKVVGVTTSSIMQIGSLRHLEAVAWLKHFRKLMD